MNRTAVFISGKLLYGAGLRLNECARLRVEDPDFQRNTITVRAAKGDKDHRTLLPQNAVEELKLHLEQVCQIYDADRKAGTPGVSLPGALAKKYPNAFRQWIWFWVFPTVEACRCTQTTIIYTHLAKKNVLCVRSPLDRGLNCV